MIIIVKGVEYFACMQLFPRVDLLFWRTWWANKTELPVNSRQFALLSNRYDGKFE